QVDEVVRLALAKMILQPQPRALGKDKTCFFQINSLFSVSLCRYHLIANFASI
ncbi:MAG: hypothetical protein UZ12_BCD005001456, partial [Bacteroidetes bacterium OLB12]